MSKYNSFFSQLNFYMNYWLNNLLEFRSQVLTLKLPTFNLNWKVNAWHWISYEMLIKMYITKTFFICILAIFNLLILQIPFACEGEFMRNTTKFLLLVHVVDSSFWHYCTLVNDYIVNWNLLMWIHKSFSPGTHLIFLIKKFWITY